MGKVIEFPKLRGLRRKEPEECAGSGDVLEDVNDLELQFLKALTANDQQEAERILSILERESARTIRLV